MRSVLNAALAAALLLSLASAGCTTVTFIPEEGEQELPSRPKNAEVEELSSAEAGAYRIIGTVSCQDSASSSIWNWWTDYEALIAEMKQDNLDRLLAKTRQVGGDALLGLVHDLRSGGGTGGMGVGVGVGGGVGVGTSLFGSNPKVIVVSHGKVGVKKSHE